VQRLRRRSGPSARIFEIKTINNNNNNNNNNTTAAAAAVNNNNVGSSRSKRAKTRGARVHKTPRRRRLRVAAAAAAPAGLSAVPRYYNFGTAVHV
jgi:hypothetical protein